LITTLPACCEYVAIHQTAAPLEVADMRTLTADNISVAVTTPRATKLSCCSWLCQLQSQCYDVI